MKGLDCKMVVEVMWDIELHTRRDLGPLRAWVMAALVISISLNVSVESVGSSFPRVILIGSIFIVAPIAPEVGVATTASHARVLKLATLSSSEADPLESLPPPVSVAPMVSPFLCSDDSEWRSKVASRSSSHTTCTPEIPTAPILPTPSSIVTLSSKEDIPIGQLYRTHPGGPCRALTMRKSVRPLHSHRLALRYTSHHLDRFTSGSSSSYSSSDHSSSRHFILGHSLSRHASPDTTTADSSTPPRFVYPLLARTLRCSEAYLYWRSILLSTMYPPMTSESSTRDSFFESSAGPSRKRYRSLTAAVTSSIHATRALVPSRNDLLLPRKRFGDSISPEDIDRDVEVGLDAGIDMEVDVGVNVEDEVEDEVESSEMGVTMEIPLQRIEDIETRQRELKVRSLIAGGERASLLEQVASLERSNTRLRGTMIMKRARANRFWRGVSFMESELRQIHRFCYYHRRDLGRLRHSLRGVWNMTITRSGMTPEAIEELVNRLVEEVLAANKATCAANALEAKSQSQNGSDGYNGNGGNGNGNSRDGND
ncbi:hypothetical protein Tco_0575937, partial [Tanacetum coccineum]